MDPIKSLISSSDPLRHDPAAEPDAEAALRRVLSEPPMFSDSLPANVLRFEDRKRRRARLAGVLTLTAAAVTAGILVATNLAALTSAPAPAPANTVADTATPTASATAATTSSPTPAATPTSSPTPAATPTSSPPPTAPAVAWTTFTDSSGQAHFQHPAIWQVTETIESTVSDLGYWNRTIRVKDASGKLLSSLHIAPDAAGGSCTPVPYQTLDAVTLDIPQTPTSSPYAGPTQFKYRVMEGAQVYAALTIDSSSAAPAGTACLLVSAIQPPQNVPAVSFGMGAFLEADGKGGGEGAAAQKSFASVAEAKAYMDTPEYRDIKRMLVSLSLTPTSTRHEFDGGKASFNLPLGWTAKDVTAGTPDYPASGITVQDETGKAVANFQHGAAGGLGGACPNEKYRMTELDTATTSLNAQWAMSAGVRFSYRVLDQTSVGKGLSYQVGLVDKSSGQVQDTCLMYTVVTGTPRGVLSFADRAVQDAAEPRFASMAEARAYMETPEYRKLKAMIRSLEINS